MKSFRAEALLVALATACAGLARGAASNHPATLVGDWIDTHKSTPADTSIWRLTAGGDDRTVRRRIVAGAGAPAVSDQRYAYWYVDGDLASGARFCTTKRPGRNGASCAPVQIDTVVASGAPRLRMRLGNYQGEHTTADRILLSTRTLVP